MHTLHHPLKMCMMAQDVSGGANETFIPVKLKLTGESAAPQ